MDKPALQQKYALNSILHSFHLYDTLTTGKEGAGLYANFSNRILATRIFVAGDKASTDPVPGARLHGSVARSSH